MAIIITHNFTSAKPDSGDPTVVNASNWNDSHAITGIPIEVYGEVPGGTINGSNTNFTLVNTPTANTEQVHINGLRMKLTDDYTIVGATVTFVVAPVSGDRLLVDYTY